MFREGSKEGAHNSKTLKLLTFGAEKLKKWMTLSNQHAMLLSTKKGAEAPCVFRHLVEFTNLERHGSCDHIDCSDGEVHYAVVH